MKYKLKMLLRDESRLEESSDIEIRECSTPKQASDMVREMHDKGFELRARRNLKGWGVELYFKEHNSIEDEDDYE
jgi:hypothetical protein